jgi:glucose-1-phosphate cytidylyltransferase
MRCVILAGGKGTRLGRLGLERPKALLKVGRRALLWRQMDHSSRHGVSDYIVATGHLGAAIRAEVEAPADNGGPGGRDPSWRIQVVDTGEQTATGGRLRRLRHLLGDGETFLLTYCDGLSDIDLAEMATFHRAHGRLVTVAAVRPPSTFGWLDLDGDVCRGFQEKPARVEGWINAGYFLVHRRALELIESDGTAWEREPVSELARMGELMAYRHHGHWACIDTPKDLERVEQDLARGVLAERRVGA